MIPLGDGMTAPADVVIALQLEQYGLHPKQLAWVMNVSDAMQQATIYEYVISSQEPTLKAICEAPQRHVRQQPE